MLLDDEDGAAPAHGDLGDAHAAFVWQQLSPAELDGLPIAPGELAVELWRAVDGFLAAVGSPQRCVMNRAAGVPVFDLTGPLPTGRTVIEASAGTGKTYSISGLVVRYVAEEAVEHRPAARRHVHAGRGERATRPHPVVAATGGRSPRRRPAAAPTRRGCPPSPAPTGAARTDAPSGWRACVAP